MKRILLFTFAIFWVLAILYSIWNAKESKDHEPYIYHLQDVQKDTHYYVYPNFKDEYHYIKYLFHFTNKHPGTLVIIGNKNDVSFQDGIDYIDESDRKSPYFFFARTDSTNSYYSHIRVLLDAKKVHFKEKLSLVDSIQGKTLKADFKDLNLNVIQEFLDYTAHEDYKTRSQHHSYVYSLYNRLDCLVVRQQYTNYGKCFTIEIM